MTALIDLVVLGDAASAPSWRLGYVSRCATEPGAVAAIALRHARDSLADAVLFWDASLGAPPADVAERAIESPGDIWHAGLALGLGGAPGLIDFVAPTWTFNRDPDPTIEATSWRVSLRACLVRSAVLRWALPDAAFGSLNGMALEWGHRCVRSGALPRHLPVLAPRAARVGSDVTLEDEIRFLRAAFGRRWSAWGVMRAALAGYARVEDLADAWLATRGQPRTVAEGVYAAAPAAARNPVPSVSVLIPTLDRPDYLRTVLEQLRRQRVRAVEIVVVDQSDSGRRNAALARDFADIPLKILELDAAGQCTARNAGLAQTHGDAILFLDDDDEVEPDLIARHLAHLAATGADVSSGVAREPTSGPLPDAFTRPRASDVFPTNNTLARRSVLERSGLFDLAYDHGSRADGDLGMRAYLSGAVMMLSPDICVLHHHAPRGGLRTHGARVVTYGSSRRRVSSRHLPDVTDLYRGLRYFSARQVREALAQSALGTLSLHAGGWRRIAKALVGTAIMPQTLWELRRRLEEARAMLERFPAIPLLPPRAR